MDTPAPAPSADQPVEDSLESLFQETREPRGLVAGGRSNPTMGNLQKVRYTHADMIDFILINPTVSQGQLAVRYGYTEAWVSNIMASDAWQAALAQRKEEIINPAMRETIEERMKGLTLQSINVLQEKLNSPSVAPEVALKALELGSKALSLGAHAPIPAREGDSLDRLAQRLIELNKQYKPINVIEVQPTERSVA